MEKLLVAPITKVDAEKREVWGYATLEVPDKTTPVPDVVDYESAKRAFAAWAGNIREMHLPIAVGKAVEIQPDDEKKGIYIGARISQSRDGQDAWTKIQEGVLTAFSIGPKAITRTPEVWQADGAKSMVNRLFIGSLAEVSLVDNPACPGCFFDVAKAVAPETTKVENDPNVGGGVDRDKLPASDFVDPKGRRFPIVEAGDVSDAVSSFGRAKPAIPFATFKRRLTAIAKRKGFESALPADWKDGKAAMPTADGRPPTAAGKAVVAGLKCQCCDIGTALQVLGGILALIDSESMEQMFGEDEADELDVLVEAFERVHEFIGIEMAELLADRAPAPAAEPEAAVSDPPSAVSAEAAAAVAADATKVEAPALEAIKGFLADVTKDLAGKADLAPLSEGLGKVEAAVGDLKGRVERMEQTPSPGGPVLRTQDLAAKGLTAVDKGGAPAQTDQARAVLADLEKRIDAAKDPMLKQELGLVYGQLCMRLGIR